MPPWVPPAATAAKCRVSRPCRPDKAPVAAPSPTADRAPALLRLRPGIITSFCIQPPTRRRHSARHGRKAVFRRTAGCAPVIRRCTGAMRTDWSSTPRVWPLQARTPLDSTGTEGDLVDDRIVTFLHTKTKIFWIYSELPTCAARPTVGFMKSRPAPARWEGLGMCI